MGTLSLPPHGVVYADANAFIYDPDEGLEIKRAVRTRLLRQQKAVAAGERRSDAQRCGARTWAGLMTPCRIRAEDVTVKLGTNNYETTSMVMARVPRIYRS